MNSLCIVKRALIWMLAWLIVAAAAAAEGAASRADAPERDGSAAGPLRAVEEELAALRPLLIGERQVDQARRRLAVQYARMSDGSDDPDSWFYNNALVVRDFIAGVHVIYALEFANNAQLVSYGMMKRWALDLERLHQRALANLDARHGNFGYKPVGKLPWLYVIDSGDADIASRMLLHWRWAELTLTLGEVLILGIPTRDVVVFTASVDAGRIKQLRETVETVNEHQGRSITRALFQWTPHGWKVFE